MPKALIATLSACIVMLLAISCRAPQDLSKIAAEIRPGVESGIWDRCPEVEKAEGVDMTDINFDNFGCPGDDSDGDGVNDDWDWCPDTPEGLAVNDAGCHYYLYYYTWEIHRQGVGPDSSDRTGTDVYGTGAWPSPEDAKAEMERLIPDQLNWDPNYIISTLGGKHLHRKAPDDLCGDGLCLPPSGDDDFGDKVGIKISTSGTGEPQISVQNDPQSRPDQAIAEYQYYFETPYDSIDGQKLARASRLGTNARRQVEVRMSSGGYPAHRMANELLNYGDDSLWQADEAYVQGDRLLGDDTIMLAVMAFEVAIDLATSFTPGISWGRDLYEAISGLDAISREELSSFARGASIVGVVTAGIFSGIKNIPRLIDRVGTVLKRSNIVGNAGDVGRASDRALEITDSANSIIRNGPLSMGRPHEISMGSGSVADTFRGGSYFTISTNKPIDLYRVQGKPWERGDHLGRFWSRDKPSGPVQSIIDSALDPTWGNTGTHWLQIRVPAGSTIYEGSAAAQRGLVGGGNQVFIEKIPSEWIQNQGRF